MTLVKNGTIYLLPYLTFPLRIVWRGAEKRKAFRAMLDFAKAHNLLSDYRWTIYWVYFKKVIATSLIDYIIK